MPTYLTATDAPITPADLGRATKPGDVWLMPRRAVVEPGAIVTDDDAERGWLDSCAPEGGKHAEPVSSGTHRQSVLSRAWLRLVRWLG